MANKRKYTEVKGYWIYSIQVQSINKYYIGVSKIPCCNRWNKSTYENTVLKEYLQEWDSMIKTVLVDNLTKGQAYQYEDNIIQSLKMNNLCINTQRSGLVASDINAYMKEYYKQWQKDNREKWNKYQREYQRQQRAKKKLEKQQNQFLEAFEAWLLDDNEIIDTTSIMNEQTKNTK